MMLTHVPPFFYRRLYGLLSIPYTLENLRLGLAVTRVEGSNARWNPWDTTEPWPGATDYNSVGVKNYRRPLDGIVATAVTLTNGHYDGWLGAMQAGRLSARAIVARHAAEFDTWGTGARNLLEVL